MHGLLIAGLFVVGAACGATVRLMVFVAVLLGGMAVGAIAFGTTQGVAQGGFAALVTVITLQVGYAAGFVLRAAIRSARDRFTPRGRREEGVAAPLGERRP